MAYRTDVRRFTGTLAAQSEQLGRLLELQKDATPAHVGAGSVSVDLSTKADEETLSPHDELVARFAIELLLARATGRTSPDMDKLVDALRGYGQQADDPQGKAMRGVADLGEAVWALPRMWDQPGAPKVGKGYPEFDPSQSRDTGGRFASGGGGGGGGSSGAHRGLGARRAELFDSYRLKYGYFPPKGMTNQRVEMWVKGKAPAGADVTHEVRGALAEYRSDEPWSTTFNRAGSRFLAGVYNWGTSPVILDTVATLALYALAVNYLPAAAAATGLKATLNRGINIAMRRGSATSGQLLEVIDDLTGKLRRPRAGWF